MPEKIRELIKRLKDAGFIEISGAGKDSHRKFVHDRYPDIVTISGQLGHDAKRYQEKQVNQVIEDVAQ